MSQRGTLPLHKVALHLASEANGKKRERTLTTKWFHRVLQKAGWNVQATHGKYRIHEELTGLEGRVDIALKVEDRVAVCIELKDPTVSLDQLSLRQAVKYASSYYYVSRGVLNPTMAICTNGLEAIIMDPGLSSPDLPVNQHKINLTTSEGTNELIEILKVSAIDRSDGSLPVITTKRKLDPRPFASNTTDKFQASVQKMVNKLLKKKYSTKNAIEMTIQCLLLAAARDNGIIPNHLIRQYEAKDDWASMAKHVRNLFGDIFEAISGKAVHDIWDIYNDTSFFNLRLDIVPVHFMGVVYEKLLSKYLKNKTSFYTPEDMIDAILQQVKPTIDDTILDPTCGSGAFLSAAMAFATKKKINEKRMLKFFDGVVGVDKDPIACKIAKVSLLCTFMRRVGEDYRRTGKRLPRPRIEPAIDFFDWHGSFFSLILGNPPWDSIDNLSTMRKLQISQLDGYQVYQDKNDQLCYIIEKALIHHLSNEGRFGFVIKQQSLLGNKYFKFAKFLDRKITQVFDYGRDQKFGNYAQSAGIIGNLEAKNWEYTPLLPETIADVKGRSLKLRVSYDSCVGAESGCDAVYKKFASEYPTDPTVIKHPTNLTNGGPPGKIVPMAFIWRDDVPAKFKAWVLRNPEMKRKLAGRADVKRSGRAPLSWRYNNPSKIPGPLLITELNLTPGRDRFPFVIDKNREFIALRGQTCISSRTQDIDDLRLLGAIMVSSFFVPLCRACKLIPRRAGGICFNPVTLLERLKLPEIKSIDRSNLLKLVVNAERKRRELSIAEIKAIDKILSPYFKISKQQPEKNSYSRQLLSEFLQPSEDVEIEENEENAESTGT